MGWKNPWKDIGRVSTGLATGGLSELVKATKPKNKTMSQAPLETPEQAAARQSLLDFANSGKLGDFQVGQDLGLGYGDFNVTPQEQQGLSSLQSLIANGIPEQYKMGDAALRDILNPDPNAINAQFDPFKAQVKREIALSNDALKRANAFQGNLYSTDTVRRLGDIQARGNETLTSKLADLANAALNRRLQAVPLAYQSAAAQEGIQMDRINALNQSGSLTRNLNDASIKARDAEILRKRQELKMPLETFATVSGTPVNFGVKDIPYQQQSPYMDLLKLGASLYGSYKGAH